MRPISLAITFTILLWSNTFAQNKDIWFAFSNRDTLIGFKNKAGKVKISPKFNDYITAGRFENIIEVTEGKGKKLRSYYLTKKGRIVGINNLYIFDNSPDCESEGFIRFRDKITHKVGIFNSDGDVVIPAHYDNLMPVRNRMIAALKGGHWDASKQSEENEFPWVGGKEILIDTNNKLLINKFRYDENINFFSLIISKQPSKNPTRQNFKANDGKFYSFMNFDREFNKWLKDSILNNLTLQNLTKILYKKITIWDKTKGWITESKQHFTASNFKIVKLKLTELKSANCSYDIFTEDLDPLIHHSKELEKYFDNCEIFKKWIYPLKTIVITHHINKDIVQDQLSFLRTDDGYKLIEVSIRTEPIK